LENVLMQKRLSTHFSRSPEEKKVSMVLKSEVCAGKPTLPPAARSASLTLVPPQGCSSRVAPRYGASLFRCTSINFSLDNAGCCRLYC
jgi:hypothetical protein